MTGSDEGVQPIKRSHVAIGHKTWGPVPINGRAKEQQSSAELQLVRGTEPVGYHPEHTCHSN